MSGSCLSSARLHGDEQRRQDWRLHALWLALSVAVLAASALLSVRDGARVVVPFFDRPLPELCMFKEAIGLDCPGCGLTRCFISLAHGDWRAAWEHHPAGILIFAAVVFQVPYRLLQLGLLACGSDPLPGLVLCWLLLPAPVLMIGQWLVRTALALW